MIADRTIQARSNDTARQALLLWVLFFGCALILNGTVPFLLGRDLHHWTVSAAKSLLFSLVIYAGLFLCAPLILVKGWKTVRQSGFLFPLLAAVLAITLSSFWRWSSGLVVPVLAYLHWRYDLSDLGFRSIGGKGDAAAVLILAVLNLAPVILKTDEIRFSPGGAVLAGLERLFANPASTVENLFYFGFLIGRLAQISDRWAAPLLIAGMYTAHEMSNPEYWYEGMPFWLVFAGIWIFAAVYLWRRSILPIWLGDGLGRFVSRLI